MVETARHTDMTASAIVFWLGGSSKFGSTPGGGDMAGLSMLSVVDIVR